MKTYLKSLLTAVALVMSAQMSAQLWMTGGTSINEIVPFEMIFGSWTTPRDTSIALPRIGGYMSLGFGKSEYETMGARYYSNISQSEANGWGDPIVGYQSAAGMVIFGAGVILGLNEPEAGKTGHFIVGGIEGGGDGPIQQVRRDPSGILGNGTYAIDSSKQPNRTFNLRTQYFAEFSEGFLLGAGFVFGSHTGVSLHVGYDFGG